MRTKKASKHKNISIINLIPAYIRVFLYACFNVMFNIQGKYLSDAFLFYFYITGFNTAKTRACGPPQNCVSRDFKMAVAF